MKTKKARGAKISKTKSRETDIDPRETESVNTESVNSDATVARSDVATYDSKRVENARRNLEVRLPPHRAYDLARMFAAFGDETRLKLLHSLAGGELCVGDLSILLEVSASAVSHQLRELRALRLVKGRRDGKMTLYSLDDEHVLTLLEAGTEHIGEAHNPETHAHSDLVRTRQVREVAVVEPMFEIGLARASASRRKSSRKAVSRA